MSKQKVQPGTSLDFLSPEEFLSGMKDHTNALLKALGRNAQFKRVIQTAVSDINGNYRVLVTPPDGFLWGIASLNGWASGQTSTMVVYMNDENSQINRITSIACGATSLNPIYFGHSQLVVHSSDQLIATNSGTAPPAGTTVALAVSVIEVPNAHEAQLLL